MADEPTVPYCRIRTGGLVSDSHGLAANASSSPYLRVCDGNCLLQGQDLEIKRGSGGITVTAKGGRGRPVPEHCEGTRFQRYT